jgi:hypothetical protein
MARRLLSNPPAAEARGLRAALAAAAAMMLLAGGGALVACGLGAAWPLSLPGLLLLAALLFERWRYKRLQTDRPGPDWVATGERFVDPESGRPVTVYHRPSTGERRYTVS